MIVACCRTLAANYSRHNPKGAWRRIGLTATMSTSPATSGDSALDSARFYNGGDGARMSLESFLGRIADHSASASSSRKVVLLGENHDDPAAHKLEEVVLERLHLRLPAPAPKEEDEGRGSLALSLEFYDREAQTVLDEYLQGFVDLETFLGDSRPPSNHSDYQPLIDYCRANSLPVVAANCPRRYTRMVSRQGRQRLQECAGSGSGCGALLPPLPYAGASEEYGRAFAEVMGIVRGQGEVPRSMLDAQSLWDAVMAHSIHKALHRHDLVLHVAGYFHVKRNLGILEHLRRYDAEEREKRGGRFEEANVLSVVVLPEEDPDKFDAQDHLGLSDLVVLSDLEKLS